MNSLGLTTDASSAFEAAVVVGLDHRPRALPSKYLYDDRGSELFEEICQLDEYYPTRAEVARHLVDQQELQQADVDPRRLNADLIRTVGPELCLRHRFVPLDRQELSHVKVLIIAVAEPMSPHELDKLGEKVSCIVYQKFAPPDQVRVALERIHRLEAGLRPPSY